RIIPVMVIPRREIRRPKRPVPILKPALRGLGKPATLAQRHEIVAGMKIVDPMLVLRLAVPPRTVRSLSFDGKLHAILPPDQRRADHIDVVYLCVAASNVSNVAVAQ